MKKIIVMIALLAIVAGVLAGCNQGLGIGSLKFDGIHFQIHDVCADGHVTKWYESESGVEVVTREHGSLFLSEGTYIMYNGDCPLCGEK